MSTTITLKEHEALFPLLSVAMYQTVVEPTGKTANAVGGTSMILTDKLLTLSTLLAIPQASVGTGIIQLCICSHEPLTALRVTLDGQVITGFTVSKTVTMALHVAELAGDASSVTVKVTVFGPTLLQLKAFGATANVRRLFGVQLSVEPAAIVFILAVVRL